MKHMADRKLEKVSKMHFLCRVLSSLFFFCPLRNEIAFITRMCTASIHFPTADFGRKSRPQNEIKRKVDPHRHIVFDNSRTRRVPRANNRFLRGFYSFIVRFIDRDEAWRSNYPFSVSPTHNQEDVNWLFSPIFQRAATHFVRAHRRKKGGGGVGVF